MKRYLDKDRLNRAFLVQGLPLSTLGNLKKVPTVKSSKQPIQGIQVLVSDQSNMLMCCLKEANSAREVLLKEQISNHSVSNTNSDIQI